MSTLDEPNYVQKNIKEMKKYRKPAPAVVSRVVDHPKGDRVAPMIVFKGRKGTENSRMVSDSIYTCILI